MEAKVKTQNGTNILFYVIENLEFLKLLEFTSDLEKVMTLFFWTPIFSPVIDGRPS